MSETADLAGRRLLVVDDEPADRAAIAQLARACGCDIRAAAGHGEMTTLMQAWAPELLVLDIVMPEVDGLAILRRLAEQHCRTPVLLVSAYRDHLKPARNLGQAYGINVVGHLTKPLEPQSFSATLQSHFCRRL
jgi:two-component system OmpR family response regulator